MKGPYVEGVAIHDDPQSCVVTGEGAGEALTGAPARWVLSREKLELQGADAVEKSGRRHGMHRYREVCTGPAQSETPRTLGNLLGGNREIPWSPGTRSPGRGGKGFGRNPLMHDLGKARAGRRAGKPCHRR
jgi:hypothetical protein